LCNKTREGLKDEDGDEDQEQEVAQTTRALSLVDSSCYLALVSTGVCNEQELNNNKKSL